MKKKFYSRILSILICGMLTVSLMPSTFLSVFAEDNGDNAQIERRIEEASNSGDTVGLENPDEGEEISNSEDIEGPQNPVDVAESEDASKEGLETQSLPILRGPKVDIDDNDADDDSDDESDADDAEYEPLVITIPVEVRFNNTASSVASTVETQMSLVYNYGGDSSAQEITDDSVDITGAGSDEVKIKFLRPGTYTYEIYINETDNRFGYSSYYSYVTVDVEEVGDGGDKTLQATLQGESHGDSSESWTEKYVVELNSFTATQFNIEINKEVIGETTQPGTFRFGVSQRKSDYEKIDLPEAVDITVSGGESGEAVMGPFVITSPGGYSFTVWEADPNSLGNADRYVLQTSPHELYVNVSADDNYNLEIEECMLDGEQIQMSSDGTLEVSFSNQVITEDAESVETTIPLKKITKGEGFPEGETFQFEIISVDGAPLPEKTVISRTGEGELSFGPITFYHEGLYKYKVREIAGDHPQIDYTSIEWTVEVAVDRDSSDSGSDSGSGDVTINSLSLAADASNIKPMADVDISGPKVDIDGPDNDPDDDPNSSADGLAISSVNGYIEDENGFLDAWRDLQNGDTLEFTNVFYNDSVTAEIPVTKIVELGENAEGKKPETSETFTFKIEAVGDAPMPEDDTITITTDEEGTASFEITYKIPGEYKYKISEVVGTNPHYEYDSTSWIAMVYIDPEYEEGEEPWILVPTESLGEPDVRVYPSDQDGKRVTDCDIPDVPDPGTTRLANSSISPFVSVVVDPINCRPVSEDGGIVFTNIYNPVETIEISGKKIWKDDNDRDGVRPDAIEITLYRFDKAYLTKTVTAEDDWSWTFTDLPKYCPKGKEYTYEVKETPVDGYTTSYEGNNIINTHESETVEDSDDSEETDESENSSDSGNLETPDKPNAPQTGDENHIVLYGILMLMAIALLIGGVILKKKR